MLSVASLLNPVRTEPRGTRLPSSPSSSLYTSSSTHGSPQLSTQSSFKKQKMPKDGAIFVKGKIKGEVNFPPFEQFDEETMREIQKFQVHPLGKIQEYPRHIPYNSEKKSFLEKTGRESFEVFQYVFKVPGDDKEYCVMWDYNIGLVRITPFFKCCKYSKTTPAKMLNMNPGLKEITHSITGGALVAQGYWMPYSCAMAVCATFCSHIAGALIPIFGPAFPSQCVPPEAPEHGRMIIDPQIVISSTQEAETYRLQNSASFPKPHTRDSYSPQHSTLRNDRMPDMRTTPPMSNSLGASGRRLRLKRAFTGDVTYALNTTDTDMDTNGTLSEASSSGDGYYCSPGTPLSTHSSSNLSQATNMWQAHNMMSHNANSSINISAPGGTVASYKTGTSTPNPILSAIPRSAGLGEMHMGNSHSVWRGVVNKRRNEELDCDDEYDGGESATSVTDRDEKGSGDEKSSDREMEDVSSNGGAGGAEKKAAWLLMKLSVKDGECGVEATKDKEGEGPRIKRRRATSM